MKQTSETNEETYLDYEKFLQSKITLAEKHGFNIELNDIHPLLKPHQKDVVKWAVKGGRRAGFLNFGLGKTIISLETCRHILKEKGGNVLIVCPLGVKHEFQVDAGKIDLQKPVYITNTAEMIDGQQYYITNYERIRKGDIDATKFTVVSFDEASVLRSLDSQTVDALMAEFKKVPFRYVFTATPSPNRFLELTHYGDYLGIMDRGQILTRFFQRDSTKAGNLNLYSRREKEFWYWMSSWACFVTRPSDLGYDDTGYDLPPINLEYHKVTFPRDVIVDKFTNQTGLFANAAGSLVDSAKEKRVSIQYRIAKAKEIVGKTDKHWILWHHLTSEKDEIEKEFGKEVKSVWGSQNLDQREDFLTGFREGKYKFLSTKPKIAGSGCNFQYHCHNAVFVGIDYKFNDFIQAVHRIYRFMQDKVVNIHIIYTDAEEDILKKLLNKWSNHNKLQNEMTDIIKKHGLNSELYREDLKRKTFNEVEVFEGNNFKAINNDNVSELKTWKDNSVGLFVTSIPFGNHYEYSENYNCFGHNETNEKFFEQMDFLTPEIYRTLQPGRILAVHCKDRIRYSYMTGAGAITTEPFMAHTQLHYIKHGFDLMGTITVTTDVVRENNQTYRLGYSENAKDSTKMGVGLPEYILILRKRPTETNNAYADVPVKKDKEKYSVGRWQIDAHAYWKSGGERLADDKLLSKLELKHIQKLWKQMSFEEGYDYKKHVAIVDKLKEYGKLPTTYMSVPPVSVHPEVWDDISRMKTLNTIQAQKGSEKHICPLQLDIIERLIERYSNEGEVVADMFGGIMSVPYQAIKMNRKGVGIELNKEYWKDGVKHLRNAEMKMNTLTLFAQ
jgi:DNA modification methylase